MWMCCTCIELGGRFRLSSDLGMVSSDASDASDRLMRLMECYSVHVSSWEGNFVWETRKCSGGRFRLLYMYRARRELSSGRLGNASA